MKVAFVYKQASLSMPLGICYLSAVVKKNGFNSQFFLFKKDEDFTCLQKIIRFKPDIIGYSVITGNQNAYLNFNKEVKKRIKNVVSVFGGPHITFFPEIIYEDGVDAVCMGEAEEAFLFFIRQFQEKGSMPESSPNFWIKHLGEVSKSTVLPLITDLDLLPFPDREGFFLANPFVKSNGRKEFNARRGCPYKCTYCFNESYNKLYLNKNILRQRHPESICDEINYVGSKFPMKFVNFVDDVFTINKDWLLNFCEEYAKRVKFPFSCNLRLNNVNEEIIQALKKANCSLVYVGTESGNEYLRNKIMRRKMSIELMLEKTELLHKYKIKILTENIIGNHGETYDMALETLRLNQKMNPGFPGCSLFTPYPKLLLTEYAISNGYFDGDYNKISENYFEDTSIKFKDEAEKNKMLNLRCFFSLLTKFSWLEIVFLRFFINIKHNKLICLFGNFVDGYYLFKSVPYKYSAMEFIRTVRQYITLPR